MAGFQKATKKAARLRLALVGPPGSGKTFTGLTLATDLGGKIAVIDTERGSASKYADLFAFDVLELADDFHPRKYIEAIKAAEQAGYASLIIDSLSHAWIGPGGGLDLHDREVDRQKVKNAFTAWAAVTPHHNALVQSLIQCRCHVIATMRSKVEYAQEKDAGGRTNIRKIGTAPLMRDGVEYEFDVVGDLDQDNTLVVTKTRCPALSGQAIRKPGADLAKTLAAWLGGAEVHPPAPQPAPAQPAKKPAAKHVEGPKSTAEMLAKLSDRDDWLFRKGLIESGALVEYVKRAVEASETEGGLGVKLGECPISEYQFVKQLVERYEGELKQAQAV